MSVTSDLKKLVRQAETQFLLINRNRSLSAGDKKQLKSFYLDRIVGPRAGQLLGDSQSHDRQNGALPRIARRRLLTVVDLEAWLKVDRKTIYGYVQRNIIPHVLIESNVRFRESEIRRWLKQRQRAAALSRGKNPHRCQVFILQCSIR